MPDYNRAATLYWWSVVGAGFAVLAAALGALAQRPAIEIAQVALAAVLAMAAGLFPVRVPGTRNSFAAGEIVMFLALLLYGPAAATAVAAAEGAVGAWRTSKRWTSRLGSPAMAALAMGAAGALLQAGRGALELRGRDGPVELLALAMAVALVYFMLSSTLPSAVIRLKRRQPFFTAADVIGAFRWVGMAYAGSAAVAVLLFVTYRQAGTGVLAVMVPLLAMLLVTLHFYFRQQEAQEEMRRAGAEAAEREAAALAREAESAARHLRELEVSERRFHAAFTHASIGMALLAFDGRILQANHALCALLGRGDADLLGRPFQELASDEYRPVLDGSLGLAGTREFEPFATELCCLRADGTGLWAAIHCSFFTEPGADAPCLILQLQDVSARRRAEAGLAHLAYHDPLTGLPNRRRFLECLGGSIARCQADPQHSFAVLFIDFDRFKLVNDSLGHSAGDELLVQLARRLQERLRPTDVVARLGGDEFALLAERIEHPRDATVLAERLLGSLARPLVVAGTEVAASASIGITFSSLGYGSAEDVLRDADTAMYKAKSEGKARYAVFDASLHTEVSRRLRLEGDLRRAIDAGHLHLAYQPVFDLAAGGRLRGFEALVRWDHPADGPLAPRAFLPIAEESGLMRRLSDFVLHGACRQLRQWQLSDPQWAELSVSVNISADDVAQPGFVSRVTRAVIESGVRPQHLTLELTENTLALRAEAAIATLTELRRLGVQVAVDDFGSGYSSLSHLAAMPVDSLKIDRSFVGHLHPGSDEAAVVRAIIQLGQSLRKAIVAEGIESAQQVEQLLAMGCAQGQGHHLSVPLDALAAGELLQRHAGAALH